MITIDKNVAIPTTSGKRKLDEFSLLVDEIWDTLNKMDIGDSFEIRYPEGVDPSKRAHWKQYMLSRINARIRSEPQCRYRVSYRTTDSGMRVWRVA